MATVTCQACGARVDAVEAWFHPGTGALVCDGCRAAAELRAAAMTARSEAVTW